MAYDRGAIFEQAKREAEDKNCYFIEQLIAYLPISKPTFYEFFPINSYEFNTIKEILDLNKVSTKTKMYRKWFDSDNPTLQVALMKIIATDEEAHRLNGTKQEIDHTTGGDKIGSMSDNEFNERFAKAQKILNADK